MQSDKTHISVTTYMNVYFHILTVRAHMPLRWNFTVIIYYNNELTLEAAISTNYPKSHRK